METAAYTAALKDIVTTIKTRLNEIGVYTWADLERTEPLKAYQRICQNNPQQAFPVCY